MHSIVRRHMKTTGRYVHARPPFALPSHIENDTTIFGYYENSSSATERVVFSDLALYWDNGVEWRSVTWSNLDDYDLPEKANPEGVYILSCGSRMLVPISGKFAVGNARDAYCLVQVLHVVSRRTRAARLGT
jgi:hypothetical protein